MTAKERRKIEKNLRGRVEARVEEVDARFWRKKKW